MSLHARGTSRRLDVVAIGDSFVPADIFRTALEAQALDANVRTVDIDESRTWQPAPGEPVLREYAGTPDEAIELAAGAQVLLVHVAPITREVLQSLPDLRLLGVARGGPVNVDVDAATELGIPVVTTPGRNATAVSELTISLAVMLLRRLPEANGFARTSEVLGASAIEGAPFVGRELREVTLGLIGFGEVGRRVAGLARAFGGRVLVHDPFVGEEEVAREGCEPRDLGRLLAESDVVSLHVRATPETADLVDAGFLDQMKAGAVLLNTARETVVDEQALVAALDSGRLSGAAVDVVKPSTSVPHPLARHPKVFVLPHVGGATTQAGTNGAVRLAAAVGALQDGAEPAGLINGVAPREAAL